MKDNSGFHILLAIIAVATVLLVGAVTWRILDANHSTTQGNDHAVTSNDHSQFNYTQIDELGVKFETKDNIKPLYSIEHQNWGGTPYISIRLSTKQISDSSPACSFTRSDKSPGFTLFSVFAYNSKEDVEKIEPGTNSEKITAANGYLTVDDKIYHIPQGIQEGQGTCNNNLETQQRAALRNSLMTLTAIH